MVRKDHHTVRHMNHISHTYTHTSLIRVLSLRFVCNHTTISFEPLEGGYNTMLTDTDVPKQSLGCLGTHQLLQSCLHSTIVAPVLYHLLKLSGTKSRPLRPVRPNDRSVSFKSILGSGPVRCTISKTKQKKKHPNHHHRTISNQTMAKSNQQILPFFITNMHRGWRTREPGSRFDSIDL